MTNLCACCCCGLPMIRGVAPWHCCCQNCGYESASLQPSINELVSHKKINESDREVGLKVLRQENFTEILGELDTLSPPQDAQLLDVGCAHGWFLEQAGSRYEVKGIEPDRVIFSATEQKGYPLRCGYFPAVLNAGETFDVIVFNDVIEHIPDIKDALASCYDRLKTGGLLVLNLPSSSGSIYRLARLLARFGVSGPFQRMWQVGYPSPHLHYFNRNNLPLLVQQHGFKLLVDRYLQAVSRSGLFERIYYGGEYNRLAAVFIYLGMSIALPLLKMLPSDIQLQIYRRVS